jgi:hypothetical protein
MNGVEDDHLKEMIKKSKEMGFKAINGQMNRRQGRLAYRSRYIPAMLYSLPAMSYDENTTNSIQQPAIGKFLQVSGFEKNFPRAITYGAKEYGGLAMPQLYVESSCCKVQSIITHINSKTDLGTLVIIVLNWMQLCCGITENILNTRKQIYYIEKNWIFSVKEFLNTVNAAINIKGIWTPKKRRVNDLILMDEIENYDMTKQEIRIFNNWRIFFQVLTVADIANQQGTHIRKRFLEKSSSISRLGRQDLKWPNQTRPDNKYFFIWLKGIKYITKMNEDRSLKKHLGNWLCDTNETTSSQTLIHKNNQLLAVQDETTKLWSIYNIEKAEHAKLFFNRTNNLEMPEIIMDEYNPIDVTIKGQYYIINPRTRKTLRQKQKLADIRTEDNILQQIEAIDEWSKTFTKNLVIYNEQRIYETNEDTIIITSDAGVRKGSGGFGVEISIKDETIIECQDRHQRTINNS